MQHKLVDILDIEVLRALFESFTEATGILAAVLDIEGKVLVATGWQDICVQFHRANAGTACRCLESDTLLASQLKAGRGYNVYQCRNGLVDVAVPIVVAGSHVGNLFTGQFLFSSPDEAFFREQAAEFGFDEAAYLSALSRVPIVSQDQVEKTLVFLGRLAAVFSEMGLAKLRVDAELAERKRAEAKLHDSEALFRSMTETSPLAVYMSKGIEQRAEYINKTFTDLFGYTLDDVPSAAEWWPLAYPDEDYRNRLKDEWQRKVALAIETRSRIEPMEVVVTCKDGSHKTISWGFVSSGEQNWAFGLDLTEVKAMERRLVQAQKMEAVGRLTGGIAHDFNNLLQVIETNLELAEIEVAENKLVMDFVNEALRAGRRGAELTQQLLAFSRKQTLRPENLDPYSLIDGMTTLLSRTLGEDISIKMEFSDGVANVVADENGLTNAFLNLALNARAAMPKGGTLTVSIGERHFDADTTVADGILPAGDYVEIAVIDSGCGMSEDVLRQAFEPFFTTKGVGEGSGLGLSMVYGFARQSGGNAVMESEIGKGTTVRLVLPAATDCATSTSDAPTTRKNVRHGIKVLLVEDDADVRASTLMLLKTLGCEVVDVETAAPVSEILGRDDGIELLISDVVLPGEKNGIELAHDAVRLRPDLKVILVSGYPEGTLEKAGLTEAGFRLLGKPFSANALSEALASTMAP